MSTLTKTRTPLLVVTLLGLGGALLAAQLPAAVETGGDTKATITFKLKPQHRSGQSGTATLVEQADGTFVVKLKVSKPARYRGGTQPAHIHGVTCARYARIKTADGQAGTIWDLLNSVKRGRSTTPIGVPLTKRTTGRFSINVHAQAFPNDTVVCGDIPKR